jgi:protein-tyrosine-phosphatase
VLCVCTANVCRSPAAELLLRAGLRRRLGERAARAIEVSSAGIWASHGRPVESGTAEALRAHGVTAADLAAVRSAPLRREAVVAADLILAAAAEHVRGAWRLQIAARYRTFTLGELAALTEGIDAATLPPITPVGAPESNPELSGPVMFSGAAALVRPGGFDPPARSDPADRGDPAGRVQPSGPAARLRALVRTASALREARRAPDMPYVTDFYDLPDPTDNDTAQRDMVQQTACHVDALLDLLAGPAPARRPARDRVHWPAWAVQWSRSRTRRGAS